MKSSKENYGKTRSSVCWEKKALMGLNVELKHYGGELYEVFTNLSCVC